MKTDYYSLEVDKEKNRVFFDLLGEYLQLMKFLTLNPIGCPRLLSLKMGLQFWPI